MYEFTIENDMIFRDKISHGRLIEREPILDKDTLLQALGEWIGGNPIVKTVANVKVDTTEIEKLLEDIKEHCRTNPTNDCPNCPRYKDDCEGLEQYEDIFGIQDELDKLTIRPDKQEELTELQLGMRNGKYERACKCCKHHVPDKHFGDGRHFTCEKWDCTFEPKETERK